MRNGNLLGRKVDTRALYTRIADCAIPDPGSPMGMGEGVMDLLDVNWRGVVLAAILYVIDHVLFALALALKTYFQKIADPADIAPTAAVAFTINHIAAVFLPALLGLLWVVSPGAVFALAAAMALISLALSLLIPRHPEPGNETILSKYAPAPAE